MNAVEIEEAISALAEKPFDPDEFPYSFLEAFGRKATEIKRLRSGHSNKSDVDGVLQRNHIHIKVAPAGEVKAALDALRESPATTKAKARFILATDGETLEAEDLTGEAAPIACEYADFPEHFGFFLPLAGISTVKQIRESAFDIKATGRLNRLYIELLRDNPEWGTAERRHDMNHFMARLIFCFFAEDTEIFKPEGLFTTTVDRMSDKDSTNTHEVIGELFRAMNTMDEDREKAAIARWAKDFPYVNGGLFSGSSDVPRFSRIARSYLLHIGNLDWRKINPDIFGSMIQAVADDEERGALGMHYTSVPNILKVLNPLFLDDLREKLEEAGDNPRKLLNLRNRMARIRVFDPACGSGNFLVIAYKEMRAIEAEINKRRGEDDRRTDIPLTNFRGIELRDFPAEIARLALIIAEYQCDVAYRGQMEALQDVLPLDAMNWITCGNALQIDWLELWRANGTATRVRSDDLFGAPLDQSEVEFENDGGETYLCGNPPYIWANNQTPEQKKDILYLQRRFGTKFRGLDYVAGWLYKYAEYSKYILCDAAFVSTNSITQGEQVDPLWGALFDDGCSISFAYRSFKWQNLAKNNAGVSVVIVGLTRRKSDQRYIVDSEERITTSNISPYLLPMQNVWVKPTSVPISHLQPMLYGSKPVCGGGLTLSLDEARAAVRDNAGVGKFIKSYVGSDEIASGKMRKCIWIADEDACEATAYEFVAARLKMVAESRSASTKKQTREYADVPHRFVERRRKEGAFIALPCVSSENRKYLTPVYLTEEYVVSNRGFGIYDSPLWYFSLLSSRIHFLWCETTSGKLETRLNYSNTLTWNTFPILTLTDKSKADLDRCAEDILLAREAHFPATIADLYDPENMPGDLRAAHDRNDEVIERIYIGRRFKNDTERLEKLFELYTKMTSAAGTAGKRKAGASS